MLTLPKIRRLVRSAIGKPDNTTHEYWEQVAKTDPYAAICTGWKPEQFDDPEQNQFLAPEFLSKDAVVLDVACGIGRQAKFMSPKVKQYVGVDFSSGMVEQARKRYQNYPNVSFVHNDGRTLSALSDNTFDLAFCELAFQHMSKDVSQSYTNEVHRVLKKGGMFIVQVPRFDHYKDDKFAFTEAENDALFARYAKVEYRAKWPAYYVMQATKG